MAQMKTIALDKIKTAGRALTVGHNRTIEFWPRDGVFVGRLHGHDIFQYDPVGRTVCLDTHGWNGTVTRAAMGDFLRYFGINGGVSFAKGLFTVRIGSESVSRNDTNVITMTI